MRKMRLAPIIKRKLILITKYFISGLHPDTLYFPVELKIKSDKFLTGSIPKGIKVEDYKMKYKPNVK